MKKYVMAVAASLMLVSAAAFAVPSAGQIEQSMTQGNWSQAESQLSEVIQAHPNNAKARYLYAQVLDREGLEARACECYGIVKREFDRLLPRLRQAAEEVH